MSNLALQEKFIAVEDDMNTVLVERSDEIHSAILCILARRHLFMVGPPGVAKSLLVDELVRRIEGAVKFKWLLTKFSVPEELFGGPDLLTLKDSGVYRRITDGKLPEAHIGWIDEIFKANSAILNSLLKILNEGQFDNPGDDPNVPLVTLFAASNEIGNTAELEALADRLHMWHHVQPIRENSNFVRMLQGSESEPEAFITLEDIYKAQAEIEHVILGDDIMGALLELRTTLNNEEIKVTDRRFHQTLAVIRAQAWLDGREVADIGDVIPLQHMLWRQLEHLPKVRDAVYDLADPVEKEAIRVREEWEAAYQAFKDATQANEMAGRRSTATLEIMRKYKGARKEVKKLTDARKHTARKCRPLEDLKRRLKELGPEILQEGFELSENDIQAMTEGNG